MDVELVEFAETVIKLTEARCATLPSGARTRPSMRDVGTSRSVTSTPGSSCPCATVTATASVSIGVPG